MNWKTIGTIFRKELTDTLRDRKTILLMVALPTLISPGLSALFARVAQSQQKQTQERRLVVQAENDERDRVLGFLRKRIDASRPQSGPLMKMLGPAVAEPLHAIAADFKVDDFEALLLLPTQSAMRDHPRYAELSSAFSSSQRDLMESAKQQSFDLDGPEMRAIQQLRDLLLPIVTLDFVTAAEVAARPATHAAVPITELPERVAADPAKRAAALALSERRIQAWLRVAKALDDDVVARDDTVSVELLYDSTIDLSNEAQRRLTTAIETASKQAAAERLTRESLPASFALPVMVASVNAAPRSKQTLKIVASFLPYILILMCFVGGLYPANDLGAGEKERLTLETLLVSPASRLEIAFGKFGVVFLASLVAGLLATASMAWTFSSGLISKELGALLEFKLSGMQVAICLLLIAPLAAVFASLMLAMSIYAKSQKEAQSLMMPLQFLIIVPAMLSMIPTIELNKGYAWVPVMNVALGLRTILTAGGATLPWTEIAIIFGSTSVFAGAALSYCAWQFGREKVIFRS